MPMTSSFFTFNSHTNRPPSYESNTLQLSNLQLHSSHHTAKQACQTYHRSQSSSRRTKVLSTVIHAVPSIQSPADRARDCRARFNPRELHSLQKEPRIQDRPEDRCHPRTNHPIPSGLGRRQGTSASQSRIPSTIQFGFGPLQRRSSLSPHGESVDSEVLGL